MAVSVSLMSNVFVVNFFIAILRLLQSSLKLIDSFFEPLDRILIILCHIVGVLGHACS